MYRLATLVLFVVALLAISTEANAAPGQVNPAFTSEGFNVSSVSRAKFLADGDIMVSGAFNEYGSNNNISGLARLNPNGTPDPSFGTQGTGFEANKTVLDFQPRSDGKVWAVGSFADFNGASDSSHIVLLNGDGTRDSVTFDTDHVGNGSGFQSDIWAVEEMADGDILIGGTFSSYGGAANSDSLLRLNGDGTVDAAWASLTGVGDSNVVEGGANGPVYTIERCPSGKFMVGGSFTQFNGNSAYRRILRINADGSLDTSFNAVGSGMGSFNIRAVHCQDDGKVLVGGLFTGYNGDNSRPNLLRLNEDGSLDTGFNPAAPNHYVSAIAKLPTGKIAIGGLFDTVGGQSRKRIAQLNANGSLDSNFNMGSGFCGTTVGSCPGGTPGVNSLEVSRGGSLLAAGEFRSYNGTSSEQIALLYDNAQISTAVNGLGTISSSPSGISCPSSCSAWYDQGQAVTLTANPASGYLFSGWSNACSGSSSCLLSANGDSATATFASKPNPDPNPDPNPNPDPDPDPDPQPKATITVTGLKAKLTKKSGRLLSTATVSLAGKVSQIATAGKGQKKKTVCKANKTVTSAGVYKLSCKLTKKARKQLKKKKLRLTITTTLTPVSGTPVAQTSKLTVKKKR